MISTDTAVQQTDVEKVWKTYWHTHDLEARNELVLRYMGLVRSIVRRVGAVSRNYADMEDLMSYGALGLIKAVESYNPAKGAGFETFAVYRIRGEVIDYIRRNDWMPRGVRRRAKELEETTDTLAEELGRRPTESEVGEKLGLDEKELKKRYGDLQKVNVVSFEELLQNCSHTHEDFADSHTPEGVLQERELLDTVTAAVEAMPERERLVVTLYYYEEFSIKEISGVLGVSESRVSQLHTRAVSRLRETLQCYINSEI